MNKLHLLSQQEREIFFREASTELGLQLPIVEKDFWVVWTLERLFSLPDLHSHLTFKGGTSLSKIFGVIEVEWHLTAEALHMITGEKSRLAANPGLARSIRHRFPYIDPLHHLQLELIRRYRLGQSSERVQRGIHLSINGIAAALRNTG